MANIKTRSIEELTLLNKSIKYEPNTGNLYWARHISYKVRCGDLIKTNNHGYIQFRLNQVNYLAHRVAWFLYYQEWPTKQIDHINGIKTDNKIENLRLASESQNAQNKFMHRNGNPVGVTFNKLKKKRPWMAVAPRNFLNRKSNKAKTIGYFATIEEAAQAVIEFCTNGQKTS